MIDKFKAARRAGVPIVAIETSDPQATILSIVAAYPDTAIVQWDIVRGLTPANEAGCGIVAGVCGADPPALVTGNPVEMAQRIYSAKNTIVFVHQANSILESQNDSVSFPFSQAVWNIRDVFKLARSTLVLLGPSFRLPMSLKNDVLVIEEPLPGVEDIKNVVSGILRSPGVMIEADDAYIERLSISLLGLSAFGAEQSLATSIVKKNGSLVVDERSLWEKKCKAAEQTKGVSIYRGTETYRDVIGYENIKSFLSRIMTGPEPPEVVVFMDEIEKMFSGFGTDLSGVTGEMMGQMLTWMQMTEALGVLLIGHPGSGKSLVSVATGNEFKKPTVVFDVSAMKGSLVGESVATLREAQRVVNAMAGGRKVIVLATCNKVGALPPELRRRLNLGTFFFDMPSREELDALWKFYIAKFGLRNDQVEDVDDGGWTGSEVKNCCNIAWRLNCTTSEAEKYVVPVIRAAPDAVEGLQNLANGRFISASYPGVYRKPLSTSRGRTFCGVISKLSPQLRSGDVETR